MKFFLPSVRVRPLFASLALAAGLAGAQRADAVVTFQFNYQDPAGQFFNDPAHPEYKQALESSAAVMGRYFANTATITIGIKGFNSPDNGQGQTIGTGGSSLISTEPGFYPTVVEQKVITNGAVDANGADDDGAMTFNFAIPFQFDASVPIAVGKFDFRLIVIHELTHCFGFISQFDKNVSTTTAGNFANFDKFLTDNTGAPLINQQTFIFDPAKIYTLTGGNNQLADSPSATGEYFSGPSAIARYDNKRVPIFSPNPYRDGSSGSHVDDYTNAFRYYLMTSTVDHVRPEDEAPRPRTYGAVEEGMMTDLGYTLASSHPQFAAGEVALQNKVYFLTLPNGNNFGYYSYLADPKYIYHFDLGYEYTFEANDGKQGVYFYDFKSGHFFYTSPSFSFPYLYDFALGAVLYYYPDPSNPQRYNTNGTRYFYNFNTGAIITQ